MTKVLRIDPIACDGHGLCAELFPEWITLDDWGYPIIDGKPIPPSLQEHADRAVRECPKLALRVAAARAASPDPGRERADRPPGAEAVRAGDRRRRR